MAQLHYRFSWQRANRQTVDITFTIQNNQDESLLIQLPAWRPGRYELGNFAKNLRTFSIENTAGEAIPFRKITKDSWQVDAGKHQTLTVHYSYYAADLNAGATWLDDEQLYVNPVNCCLYLPNRRNEPCTVELMIPADYQIACDLPRGKQANILEADSFDRLADAPFVASAKLLHHEFEESGHLFHLWFMGRVNPPWEKLENDFKPFCKAQIDVMGPLPGREFHFIFQILPVFYYHGVEHTYSTVCALGPDHLVFTGTHYDNLLGVSSHELFHAWNVKTMRPAEMHPYDYTRENYSRLGWIYEGITTYYGDQFLIRSGSFNEKQYFDTIHEKLQRHFASYGRLNQAVADASFDTWLDGYVPGIPHRKTSIYTEGSLIALILDMKIREHSQDRLSLDQFIRNLLDKHAAYTKADIIQELLELGVADAAEFYAHFIEKPGNLEPLLHWAFARVGLKMEHQQHLTAPEHLFGFQLVEGGSGYSLGLIAPDSPAEKAGLRMGDILVAVEGIKTAKNLTAQIGNKTEITMHIFSAEKLREVKLHAGSERYFESRKITIDSDAPETAVKARKSWVVNL
jgi:predicted metalloprotease with PDZ domain